MSWTSRNPGGGGFNCVLVRLNGNSHNFLFHHPSKVVCYLRCSSAEHGWVHPRGGDQGRVAQEPRRSSKGASTQRKRGQQRPPLPQRNHTMCKRDMHSPELESNSVQRRVRRYVYVYIYIYRQAKDSRKVQHWTTTLSRFQVKRRASL